MVLLLLRQEGSDGVAEAFASREVSGASTSACLSLKRASKSQLGPLPFGFGPMPVRVQVIFDCKKPRMPYVTSMLFQVVLAMTAGSFIRLTATFELPRSSADTSWEGLASFSSPPPSWQVQDFGLHIPRTGPTRKPQEPRRGVTIDQLAKNRTLRTGLHAYARSSCVIWLCRGGLVGLCPAVEGHQLVGSLLGEPSAR